MPDSQWYLSTYIRATIWKILLLFYLENVSQLHKSPSHKWPLFLKNLQVLRDPYSLFQIENKISSSFHLKWRFKEYRCEISLTKTVPVSLNEDVLSYLGPGIQSSRDKSSNLLVLEPPPILYSESISFLTSANNQFKASSKAMFVRS